MALKFSISVDFLLMLNQILFGCKTLFTPIAMVFVIEMEFVVALNCSGTGPYLPINLTKHDSGQTATKYYILPIDICLHYCTKGK